jgi:hypothetical protein
MSDPAELPGPDEAGTAAKFGGRLRWEIPYEIPYEIPREIPWEIPYEIPQEIPGEIPQELPASVTRNVVQELLAVRNRLHAIENAAIVERFSSAGARFGGIIGGPNELPNPEDPGGGGGGGGVFPGEIPWEIDPRELPVPMEAFEALIDQKIDAFRVEIMDQLKEIRALVAKR